MKRTYLSWTMSAFMAFTPVAVQAAQDHEQGKPASTAKAAITKPEEQKLRGVPLWLLLGGLGMAAIILAASNSGKDDGKPHSP